MANKTWPRFEPKKKWLNICATTKRPKQGSSSGQAKHRAIAKAVVNRERKALKRARERDWERENKREREE